MKEEIHLLDLPIEKTYIKLNDNFRERFFELSYNKYNSWNKLGKSLGVKRADTIIARNWRYGDCCTPLSVILKISKEINISINEIENNIAEIKFKTSLNKRGGSSGKPIINPNLPIIINEDFMEIIGHICGDGSITRSSPHKGVSLRYVNSEPILIESFKEKVRRVFGNIEPNIQIRNGGNYTRDNYCLQYPTILSMFILSVFDCQSNELKDAPEFIFDLPIRAKCSFLRALFDDEGTVSVKDKAITIGLKPIKIVEKIRSLLIELGFNPSKIFMSGGVNKIILCRKEDIILFNEIIGFKHPSKNEKLISIIKNGWKFNRYINGEVKEKIVEIIKDKKTANLKDFAIILNRHPETIRRHLNNMQKEKFIISKRENNEFLWSLNEQT